MKKLLLTGSSGLLGGNINFEIGGKYEIFGLYKNKANPEIRNQFEVDLTDHEKIREIVHAVKPDIVVHCAALTDVELCEKNYSLAHATNALATKNLLTTVGPEARFIYISTDSVFDGRKGDYKETDSPSPVNNYAKTKLEGEIFVEKGSPDYVIIRTNIFGWSRVKGESFAEWIFNNLSQRKVINMFEDVIFSPVTGNTLSLFLEKMLNSNFKGIINTGSRSAISKYDFGVLLARQMGLDTSLIRPISVDSFPFKAKRPKNTSINLEKFERNFGTAPELKDEITKFCLAKKRVAV